MKLNWIARSCVVQWYLALRLEYSGLRIWLFMLWLTAEFGWVNELSDTAMAGTGMRPNSASWLRNITHGSEENNDTAGRNARFGGSTSPFNRGSMRSLQGASNASRGTRRQTYSDPRSPSSARFQCLGMRTRLGTTHPTLTNFEKNQLFDLRPDLARSWVLPGDWRPRNAILSTFWCIRFLLI